MNTDTTKEKDFESELRKDINTLAFLLKTSSTEKEKRDWLESYVRSCMNEYKKHVAIEVEKAIKKLQNPTRISIFTPEWMRNVYGIDDEDTFTAGEVQETIEQAIYDYLVNEDNQPDI